MLALQRSILRAPPPSLSRAFASNVPATTPTSSPTITSSDEALPPSLPIAFRDPNVATIIGNDIQQLRVTLHPNQILRTESASMLYMTDGVTMESVSKLTKLLPPPPPPPPPCRLLPSPVSNP